MACQGRWLPATAADGKKGVIDWSGRWRIPAEYDEILPLPDFSGAQYFRLTRDDAACLARVTAQGWRCSAFANLSRCETARGLHGVRRRQVRRRLDPDRLLPVGPRVRRGQAGEASRGRGGSDRFPLGLCRRIRATRPAHRLPGDRGGAAGRTHIAKVQRDERWGVVDLRSGQLLVPVDYEALSDAGNGHYAMRRGGRWGIVRDGGQEVLGPRFGNLVTIRGDLLWFKEDDRYVLLTNDGRPAVEAAPDWMLRIYDLADYSERAWAAATEGELYFIDKRNRSARETAAPAGYRWVVANRT
ncbi:MAG: WG repeat-containing protein [Proteobacteria bacterium]|nr:WG repeat-containing protein [Pseudomonadota bacterium]